MKSNTYTCKEYREEMTLLGLQRRLNDPCLSEKERINIIEEIQKLELKMQIE